MDCGTTVSCGCHFISDIFLAGREKEKKACHGTWPRSNGQILIQIEDLDRILPSHSWVTERFFLHQVASSLNIVARYSGILQLNLLQVAPIHPLPFSRIKSECIWRLVVNLIIECNRRNHFWCCLWYSQENYLWKKTLRRRTKKGKNLAYERDRVQKPLLHSVYNLLEYVFQDSQCSTVCLPWNLQGQKWRSLQNVPQSRLQC